MGAATGPRAGRQSRSARAALRHRRYVDALLWMARPSGRWRDLPERFGDHQAVKRRDYRWIERGALDAFLQALTAEADLKWLMIDSTIVRAHQHAAGARLAKGGGCPRSGPLPRRPEHQDPRRDRCARQCCPPAVRAGSARRHHQGACLDRGVLRPTPSSPIRVMTPIACARPSPSFRRNQIVARRSVMTRRSTRNAISSSVSSTSSSSSGASPRDMTNSSPTIGDSCSSQPSLSCSDKSSLRPRAG